MQYVDYVNHRRQYQELGRDLLLTKKHACLFFEPGKGKTYPCIDAMREIDNMKGGKANVLIISSADAIRRMWNVDIVPQHILPKNTFLVTDRTAIGDTSQILLAKRWDILVVDECHILKANSSKIHKLIYKLAKNIDYVWGLTGTPRGNSDIDIWCQLQAMWIGGQGKFSYTAWTRTFCDFETGYSAYGRFQKPTGLKEKYRSWWNDLLDECCLFVNYDEEDDMPDLNIEVLKVPYKKTEDYDNAIQGIISVGEFATTMQKIVAINKAQQVCNGYIYLPDKSVHRYHANGKIQYLDALLKGQKTVIVYKHIADYEELLAHYGKRATNDIDVFKLGRHEILLLQCGECKSFNLQSHCHLIIFYTMDYSFIKFKQMIHRCWRLGQNIATNVIVMQHEGTVEKQIWNAVQGKYKIHDLYMSIKKAV